MKQPVCRIFSAIAEKFLQLNLKICNAFFKAFRVSELKYNYKN